MTSNPVSPTFDTSLLIESLRLHQPLFAVFDAARDSRILDLVRQAAGSCESLYEGSKAVELEDFAPYLVAVDASPTLLQLALQQGWGQSWGIYLSSTEPLSSVRKHLRRFLMVDLPEGQSVYFRFYDPRVLRSFLPTLNKEERADFFGPIDCFLMESDATSDLLIFRAAE